MFVILNTPCSAPRPGGSGILLKRRIRDRWLSTDEMSCRTGAPHLRYCPPIPRARPRRSTEYYTQIYLFAQLLLTRRYRPTYIILYNMLQRRRRFERAAAAIRCRLRPRAIYYVYVYMTTMRSGSVRPTLSNTEGEG